MLGRAVLSDGANEAGIGLGAGVKKVMPSLSLLPVSRVSTAEEPQPPNPPTATLAKLPRQSSIPKPPFLICTSGRQ
jgi:hypothetical protein